MAFRNISNDESKKKKSSRRQNKQYQTVYRHSKFILYVQELNRSVLNDIPDNFLRDILHQELQLQSAWLETRTSLPVALSPQRGATRCSRLKVVRKYFLPTSEWRRCTTNISSPSPRCSNDHHGSKRYVASHSDYFNYKEKEKKTVMSRRAPSSFAPSPIPR
jgi:hypothetical protein